MPIITTGDIPSDTVVDPSTLTIMVDGANAKALRVAPCLGESPTADQLAEAKLILVGAVVRWAKAGSGAVTQMAAASFSVTTDTRERGGYNFWPSEISQLVEICAIATRTAFSIDTVPELGDE